MLSILFLPAILSGADAVDTKSIITLSLEEAVEMALNQNRNIIRSMNDEESAMLNLNSSLTAFDLKVSPAAGVGITETTDELSTGITLSKRFLNGIFLSGTPSLHKGDTDYNSRLAISLNIPLLKYAGHLVNEAEIRSSEFSLRNAKKSALQAKENIFLNTVTAFYNISELKKTVELNQFLVKQFDSYSIIARTKTDIGLADPFDVYRSEIQSKTAQVSLSNSIESLQNARNDFKSLLAIPQHQTVSIKDTELIVSKVQLTLEDSESLAFQNSIEIKQAEDILKELKRNSSVAKRLLLPELKLSLAYSRETSSPQFSRPFMDNEEDTWGIYFVSSGDLDRKVAKNNYYKSKLNIKSGKIELEDIKDQLSKNVRRQLDTLNEAWDRIGLIKNKILDATGKQKLATAKFSNGLTGNFDLIEAETELHQARLDLLRSEINYIKNTFQLRKLLGTLIQ